MKAYLIMYDGYGDVYPKSIWFSRAEADAVASENRHYSVEEFDIQGKFPVDDLVISEDILQMIKIAIENNTCGIGDVIARYAK